MDSPEAWAEVHSRGQSLLHVYVVQWDAGIPVKRMFVISD